MTKTLAKTISWLHIFCIIYLVFGFLSPKALLFIHILAVPLVILQWKMNKNQCVLTQLQKKVEAMQDVTPKELEGNFTKELFLKWGIELSEQQLFFVIYGLLLSSWMISLSRFFIL